MIRIVCSTGTTTVAAHWAYLDSSESIKMSTHLTYNSFTNYTVSYKLFKKGINLS